MVDVLDIPEKDGVDKITVFWRNWELGRGQVTIVCYGSAWTCYFGAMSGDTIQQFFSRASVDYLAGKLIDCRWQKRTNQHSKYLEKIVTAVQAFMRTEEHSQ